MLRPLPLALLTLLLLVQGGLWLGNAGVPYVASLRQQLQAQQARNATLRSANTRLMAEVEDLKQGLEMVEDKARRELGMVKRDEILVLVTRR